MGRIFMDMGVIDEGICVLGDQRTYRAFIEDSFEFSQPFENNNLNYLKKKIVKYCK